MRLRTASALLGATIVVGGCPVGAGAVSAPSLSQARLASGAQSAAVKGAVFGFGGAVAIYGSTAVVGAPGTDSRRGAAYVFVRSGRGWVQRARLTVKGLSPACPQNHARDAVARACAPGGARFGAAVAIYGSTVVVGAPGQGGEGAAYVFRRSGNSWPLSARLHAKLGARGDDYGFSVAIHGSTTVVGAPGTSIRGMASTGAAYVFVPSGSSWHQQGRLVAPNAAPGDDFGFSVAIWRSRVVVGAPDENSFRGAAYVFARSGKAWSEQGKLTASDAAKVDDFGRSVAIYRSTVVVGAPGKNSGRGAAYVFMRSARGWSQHAKLSGRQGTKAKHILVFGWSVAIYGSTAVIGAEHMDSGRGAAYVFVRSGSAWSRQSRLTAPDRASGDDFGSAVALYKSTTLVGAPGKDSGRGAAYVFVRSGSVWHLGGQNSGHLLASNAISAFATGATENPKSSPGRSVRSKP